MRGRAWKDVCRGCLIRIRILSWWGAFAAFCVLAGQRTVAGSEAAWIDARAAGHWSPRCLHASAIFHGKMWVLGGLDVRGRAANDVWYSTDGTSWTQTTPSAEWSARSGHTSVVFDNKMWVLGGGDSQVWYSSDGTSWTQATASAEWSGRSGHTSVIFDNKMWVIGGSDRNDVWSSSDGRTWIQVRGAAPWSGRSGHTSVVMGGRMWVMGGTDLRYDPLQREPKNDVWYSEDGANWSLATSEAPWEARSGHTSAVFRGRIWLVNGVGRFLGPDSANGQRDIWSSEDGVSWTKATDEAPWSYRSSHTSLVFQDKLWVIGGFTGGGFAGPVYLNDVWHCVTPDFALPFRNLVTSFYELALGREAETGAVDAWQTYFDYALTFDIDVRFVPREMARLFFLSDEYAARQRTNAEFIEDCYQVFLSRSPNPAELQNWLGGAWNRSQVISIFAESQEFADRIAAMYPSRVGNRTRNLVTTLYLGLLNRLVDQGGLTYFAGLFDQSQDKRALAKWMAQEVINSEEFLARRPTTEDYVVRLYRAFLGRFPNDSEIATWRAEIEAGRQTPNSLIGLFGDSPEFSQRLQDYFGP